MQRMSDPHNAKQACQAPATQIAAGLTKRWHAVAVVILCSICAAFASFSAKHAFAVANEQTAEVQPVFLKSTLVTPLAAYSKFSHSSPAEHAALTGRQKCASCHRPNGSLEPSFPKHRDCTGCHLVQFTANNGSSASNPICTICHNETDLNSPKASPKKFSRLRSFTAEFDHAQHLQGMESARPEKGCAHCHAVSRGVTESLPAGLNAHRICYDCHASTKKASNLSSCGVCHGPGSYAPTSTASRGYRVGFSHSTHTASRQLTCTSCHNIGARGLPQRRQISSISPAQHFSSGRAQSCMTCHNGRRAFGDTDTHDCKRCHKKETFGMSE